MHDHARLPQLPSPVQGMDSNFVHEACRNGVIDVFAGAKQVRNGRLKEEEHW